MLTFEKAGKVAISATIGCMAAYIFIKQTMTAPELLAYCLAKPANSSFVNAGCMLFSLLEGAILAAGIIGGGLLGLYEHEQAPQVEPIAFGFTN